MFRKIFILALLVAWAQVARGSVVNCDPTANTLAQCISTATSNSTVPGTVVLVPNSTTSVFSVSSTVSLPSNLTVRCEPNATIKQSGATGSMLSANGTHNILVEDCIIDGNSGTTQGLVLTNVSAVRVSHNTFQNFNAEGISGQGGGWTDVEIDGNTFNSVGPSNANDAAILLFAQNGAASSARVKVHHNTCNNITQLTGCLIFEASSSKTLTQVAVTDNTFNVGALSGSVQDTGIGMVPTDLSDSDIQQFTVTDNIVSTNPGSTGTTCIWVSGRNGVIGHNTLSNCQFLGIELISSFTEVIGNTLSGTGSLAWDGNTSSHSNVTIVSNTITSASSHAIHVVAGFSGNFALNTGIIAHNMIRAPAGDGVMVQTAAVGTGTVTDIHIDDNVFDTFSSSQRAIDSEGSPAYVQIDNNRFVAVSGTGLFLNNGGTNYTIRLNYFNGGTWLTNFGTTVTRSVENIVNGTCCQ